MDLLRGEKVYNTKKQEYEKLVQKTLKTQIENVFLKRGFQAEVTREPQLLNDKRPDFLVRYGFTGPIVVEVKLTSNSDIKGSKIEESPSYRSMNQYMEGYGASHGIFIVVDNRGVKNLAEIKATFEKIPNVWVQSFDCAVYGAASKGNRKIKSKVRSNTLRAKPSKPPVRRSKTK